MEMGQYVERYTDNDGDTLDTVLVCIIETAMTTLYEIRTNDPLKLSANNNKKL